jgi:hypothetical protein
MHEEIGQELKGFTSQRDRITSPAQLLTLGVERTLPKYVAHRA